ncbi:MAG: recombinase RecT [Cohaesibacter sp.]|jgi:hypothetical protein|nr:recombinase RecT [Cohaesibacter sp.]
MNELVKHEERKPAIAAGAKVAAIVPTSFDETYRVAKAIVASGMAPNSLNTPEKAMVAIMHGMEVGMTPMVALQSIAVINGNPSIWGDGAIGLVRGSGLMEWIEETLEGDGMQTVAICRVKRVNEPKPIEGRFSVAQAERAGLWKKKGPWTQYPERMLKMRARAFALRDGFADILRGLSIREEVEDYPERQTRSQGSLSERLAAKKQEEPTDEGFNQDSINQQIENVSKTQSEPEDAIDVEPEADTPETENDSENAPESQQEGISNLTEGQLDLLSSLEDALSGCRTQADVENVIKEFEQDVLDAGDLFEGLATKSVMARRAEIGQ